jgi:hypothetical protein
MKEHDVKGSSINKVKRSYYLPSKLVAAFDAECRRGGYVREAVVSGAVHNFLDASPSERQKMFERLDAFLSSKRSK